jgi:hypothetical protein
MHGLMMMPAELNEFSAAALSPVSLRVQRTFQCSMSLSRSDSPPTSSAGRSYPVAASLPPALCSRPCRRTWISNHNRVLRHAVVTAPFFHTPADFHLLQYLNHLRLRVPRRTRAKIVPQSRGDLVKSNCCSATPPFKPPNATSVPAGLVQAVNDRVRIRVERFPTGEKRNTMQKIQTYFRFGPG